MTNALNFPGDQPERQVFPQIPDPLSEMSRPPKDWDPDLVIAVHKIGMSDPKADLVATGQYDAQGAAIVRKATITVMPDEYFTMTDTAERGRLLTLGAIRYPTEMEATLHEKLSAAGAIEQRRGR